jgi:hypothetical protein
LYNFKGFYAVPSICDDRFQHSNLLINCAPQVVPLAVDLHENLVQVPLLIRVCTHFLVKFGADFSGKNRAKSIPPAPQSFVADVDPALVQQVLDIAERKWKSNVHHDRQADDLGAAMKVLEGVCFRHQKGLGNRPARLKQIYSDKADWAGSWQTFHARAHFDRMSKLLQERSQC